MASAQEALATKLAGLELDTNGDGEINVEAGDATRVDVTNALTAATTNVEAQLGTGGDFAAAGNNTKQGLIADGREAAQTAIDDAQGVLDDAEEAAGSAVLTAISAVESRVANYEQAIDAAAAADVAENGELAKFNAVNDDDISFVNDDTVLQLGNVTVANLVDGEWVVVDDADLSNATGFDAYLASLQAQTDTANAESAALTALQNAIAEVVALENDNDDITAADLAPGVISVAIVDGSAEVTVNYVAALNEAELTVNTLDGVEAPAAPQVVETLSSDAEEDQDTVIFTGLAVGQSVTVAGKTVTAELAALTAAEVADLFATGDGTDLDNWTAAATATGTAGNEVVFTSTDSDAAEKAPITVSTAGRAEVATVTFVDLVAGQSVTVAGRTFTATDAMTAEEVANEFATGDNTDLTGWTAGAATGTTVPFTSDATDNVEDISAVVSDFGATAPEAQAVLDARTGLENAELALQDLNDAISTWEAAVALDAEVTGLETAVTEAREAIENAVEDGGLGITLLEGNDNFTAESDVYLFNAEAGNQTLVGFGASGEDKIFFGEGFNLVQIPEDKAITDNVGNVGELEILWEQVNDNLVLYVEQETFAGNSSAGATNDITTITLNGVSAEDISFEGGFLSIAAVEVA